jgi:outer membrane protein assembly factor BamC
LEKFQGWLDRLNMLNTRQKFRTRLDRGEQENTTEIFMSHRAVADNLDDGKERTRTTLGVIEGGYKDKKTTSLADEKAASAAEELDIELLRRLMVRLGIEEQKSRSIMADNTPIARAKLNKSADGTATLTVNDEFDRAWRRVGLALDRIGFVVEDKNRSSGLYFVRYTDVELDTSGQKKKGVLESLKFWGDDKDKKEGPKVETKKEESSLSEKLKFWKASEKNEVDPSKQYRIKLEADSEKGCKVTVVDKEGNINKSSTANVILNMLYEQLK